MHEWSLYLLACFNLSIVFSKVQIVATKVAWLYWYGHYFCSHTYLDDVASNVELFLQIAPSHFSYLRHRVVSLCSLLYGLDTVGAIVICVGGGGGDRWRRLRLPNDRKTTTLGNLWITGNSIFSDNGSRPPARECTSSLLQYVIHKLYYLLASFTNTMSLN